MPEAGTLTLAQLRTQIRERSDQKNASGVYTTSFITDSELNNYINQSYFELYDILVQKFGDDYYVAPALEFTADGSSQLYAFPNGTNYGAAPAFYKFMGLDLALGGETNSDGWVTVRNFMFSDRNRYAVPNFQSFYGVTNLRYRITGNYLYLTPVPSGGQIFRLWYVPRMTELSSDSDTVDGVSGWTEYIIVDACIKILAKEESDTSVFLEQKRGLLGRIEAAAENRDAGNPQTVCDTQWQDYTFPVGGYYGGSY